MENNFKHVMLDLETMGQQPTCAVISIAAATFDIRTGAVGTRFYCNVSLKSCTDFGLVIEPDTVNWWMEKSAEARAHLFTDEKSLPEALIGFRAFLPKDALIWGNPARFDLGILTNSYVACKMKVPWDHYNERCLRTLSSLRPEFKENMPFVGIKHYAPDDVLHQIKYANAIYNSLNLSDHEPAI